MPDPIDVFATQPHYLDHLLPVLEALPEDRQGGVFMPRAANVGGRTPPCTTIDTYPPPSSAPIIVAGYQDIAHCARRPIVFLSHGAGQTYIDAPDSPSYDGGPGRERVGLFLCPNERSAKRNLDRYPDARAEVIGCPKLDRHLQIPKPENEHAVVAVSFHWPCTVTPEAGWAWPTWHAVIEELSKTVKVLGHAHPRAWRQLKPWYESVGIETVETPEELLARADVLVIDNSSFGYEWAACDRPTVWLDDVTWRRDVEHGLRFWDQLPGPRLMPVLANVHNLRYAIRNSMTRFTITRMNVAHRLYGHRMSGGSQRAAEAILGWEFECLHA